MMARDAKPHVKWDDEAGVAANARSELPKLAQAFFAEVREVLAGNPRLARLHPLRVSGKRLRYSLDLFRPCYDAGLEERIEALKQVQDLLGQVNDLVASVALIRKSMRPSRLRTQVERFAGRRAAEKAKAFREHWGREFDAPGREEWWTGYLAREAHAPERK
ncbi:MAG TPA: CHAD domain-containing protein [Bryobacteraceae bacterium]|nr:CHAD domain-containing protein [Bryobacteraceae bacterium]